MTLRMVRADPAGNITLLVLDPVAPADRPGVARRLLAIPDLTAEQVGFILPPSQGGVLRLAMMGGEFCGNALRSAGAWFALQNNLHAETVFPVEVAGSDRLFQVTTDLAHGAAWAEMPLPEQIDENFPLSDRTFCPQAVVVRFPGIAHALLPGCRPDKLPPERVASQLCRVLQSAAVGVLYLDVPRRQLQPVVYVRATDTLVFENSCASGSAAVAAWLCRSRPDGLCTYDISQPGGTISAQIRRQDGKIRSLMVGGPIALGPVLALSLS